MADPNVKFQFEAEQITRLEKIDPTQRATNMRFLSDLFIESPRYSLSVA